jgi:hypothetical protein
MIGSTPAYQSHQALRAQNNVIVPIGGDDDYKKALTKKPNYVS